MTNLNDPGDEPDEVVIEFPADTHVYTEDDDLTLPEENLTGDQTGGLGAL